MSRSHSNVLLDGLTPGQERAIRAMLTARSIAAAARQADVGQSTLRRWIREDDNFQNKLRQYREQALSHAALMLQQGAARAVCIMYELIQSGRPIEPGRVLLIRTAIEYAFRSAVYCDIIERVKALEKAQRQPAANTRPTPKQSRARQQAVSTSERSATARSRARQQAVSTSPRSASVADKHFAKPPATKREFSETCSELFRPHSQTKAEFSWTCSYLLTPGRPRKVAPARYEVFALSSPWQKSSAGEKRGLPSDSRSWNPIVSNSSATRESVAVPFFRHPHEAATYPSR